MTKEIVPLALLIIVIIICAIVTHPASSTNSTRIQKVISALASSPSPSPPDLNNKLERLDALLGKIQLSIHNTVNALELLNRTLSVYPIK
jgi:peptidoglycan hydrolase CwlO-like protein